MRKRVFHRVTKVFDTAATLSCSLVLSAYIVYYAMFKYKGASATDNSESRS